MYGKAALELRRKQKGDRIKQRVSCVNLAIRLASTKCKFGSLKRSDPFRIRFINFNSLREVFGILSLRNSMRLRTKKFKS